MNTKKTKKQVSKTKKLFSTGHVSSQKAVSFTVTAERIYSPTKEKEHNYSHISLHTVVTEGAPDDDVIADKNVKLLKCMILELL
jgi:hypothetical protein